MPYYRRKGYYNKRGRRKSNIFYRRAGNKAYRMAKKALNLINVEKKFLDSNTVGTVSTAGVIGVLNACSQGTDNIQRTGKVIKIISIYCCLQYTINSLASHSIIRFLLLWDKQPNSALPAITDVLQSVGIVNPINRDRTKRFKILRDKRFFMSITGKQEGLYKTYIKTNVRTQYDGNAGDVTDLSSMSLVFILISDEAVNTPTVSKNFRVRFIDN